MEVRKVIPLDEIRGQVNLENDLLIFRSLGGDSTVEKFVLSKAAELFKRVYKLIDCGIEITVLNEDGSDQTLFLAFDEETQRDEVYD